MSGREKSRLIRLKCLYWYTILGAGAAGLWPAVASLPRLAREAPGFSRPSSQATRSSISPRSRSGACGGPGAGFINGSRQKAHRSQ